MPPKKRDKEPEGSKAPRTDQVQADHELFLQAFEKPTQIYRFLRTRNQISPIFLYRNLSYMRQRMSRSHKTRENFKVDSILGKKLQEQNVQKGILGSGRGYINISFLGFYDKRLEEPQENPVKVDTILLTICHKKRKDVTTPIMQVPVGTSEVPINPPENHPQLKNSSINIPNESFSVSNGHVSETYMLLLRAYCMPSTNNYLMHNCDTDEPAQKRRKTMNGSIPIKIEETKLYGSELIIYDKHNRCLLTDGNYELSLQEVQTSVRSSPKKQSFWETITEVTDCTAFGVFNKCPTLKFKLTWVTDNETNGENKVGCTNGDNKENQPRNVENDKCSNYSNSSNNNNNPPLLNGLTNTKKAGKEESSSSQQIVYQFLYNNNSRQQTEACEDLHCPWCSLDCGRLYSLLKHLKLCHSRFTFTYVPISQGARVDVAINECYDGSYAGSPHELIAQPSSGSYSRTGPTRRTTVTNILVCRPKRVKPSLSEFLELDENDYESQRPYITGHNRLYHRTVTCLPIYPKEMDVDSEGENDPKWLRTKTMMMIDDFTDVNEGEKELMKMWNLHIMKHGYVGDCQIPLACTMFLEAKGKELLKKNLYRNFVLHLCSLFDFGLISPVVLYQIVQKLQEIMREEGEDGGLRRVLQKSHESQVRHWVVNGVHPKIKKQLSEMKNPQTKSGTSRMSLSNKSLQNGMAKDTALRQSEPSNRRRSVDTAATLRRKSGEANSSEFHRRKLVLDVIPVNGSNQKSYNASSEAKVIR